MDTLYFITKSNLYWSCDLLIATSAVINFNVPYKIQTLSF